MPSGVGPRKTTICSRSRQFDVSFAQHAYVVSVKKVGDREKHLRFRLLKHIACLAALESGIDRHHHCAASVGRQRGDRPLPDVRRPDRHSIAFGHTARHERPCSFVDAVTELGVVEADIAFDQARRFRDSARRRRRSAAGWSATGACMCHAREATVNKLQVAFADLAHGRAFEASTKTQRSGAL